MNSRRLASLTLEECQALNQYVELAADSRKLLTILLSDSHCEDKEMSKVALNMARLPQKPLSIQSAEHLQDWELARA
jgi:hypothetical protein